MFGRWKDVKIQTCEMHNAIGDCYVSERIIHGEMENFEEPEGYDIKMVKGSVDCQNYWSVCGYHGDTYLHGGKTLEEIYLVDGDTTVLPKAQINYRYG